MASLRLAALVLLSGVASTACSDRLTLPEPVLLLEYIPIVGNGVSVNSLVPQNRKARAVDFSGKGIAGALVRFEVAGGRGSITSNSARTDEDGTLTLPLWTVGTQVGTDSLLATADGYSGTVVISVTVLPGPPDAIVFVGQNRFVGNVRATLSPAPKLAVLDRFGNRRFHAPLEVIGVIGGGSLGGVPHSTGATGIATVSDWRLGDSIGTQELLLSASPSATIRIQARALAAPLVLRADSPEAQVGSTGLSVPLVPRVRVLDGLGRPLSGIPVRFSALGTGSTVDSGLAVSSAAGLASPLDWRVGDLPGRHQVLAKIEGLSTPPVLFEVDAAHSRFRLQLRFIGTLGSDERDAIVNAASRWTGILKSGLDDVRVSLPAGACADGRSPRFENERVDDLVVFVAVEPLDGAGGVIAAAGPCVRRTSSFLTAIGVIRIDAADAGILSATDRLGSTVAHEMGHVLGFGTAWPPLRLVLDWGGTDPVFIGRHALLSWQSTGWSYSGRPVPLENTGGLGTRDVHWRKSVLGPELMTAFIEKPGVAMPLSELSLSSMADLGYQVDLRRAERLSSSQIEVRTGPERGLRLVENQLRAEWEAGSGGTMLINRP